MVHLFLLALTLFALSVPASATIFGFACIPATPGCLDSVDPQMTVNVTDFGSGQSSFLFKNNGAVSSIIADLYFDDRTSAGSATNMFLDFDSGLNAIVNSLGVNFIDTNSGGNLPRGNSITPAFTEDRNYSRKSKGGVSNGVNNYTGIGTEESLELRITRLGGKTHADVISALQDGLLRIGMHVQSLPGGRSDSLVNNLVPLGGDPGTPAVPEPATYAALLGLGMLGMYRISRRRRLES